MDAMAQARQESAIGTYRMMKNAISGIGIVVGEQFVPAMTSIARMVKALAGGILNFAETFPTITKLVAALTASLGVALMLAGGIKILMGAVTLMKVIFPITTIMTHLFAGGMGTLAASVWATVWPILAITAAVAGLLYLLQKLSGVDIFGGVKDAVSSAVPEIKVPTMMQPNMAMAMPGGTPVDLSGAMPTAGSGSQQTTVHHHDMRTTRVNYSITAAPGMNEEKLARIIDKHRRAEDSKSPGGNG